MAAVNPAAATIKKRNRDAQVAAEKSKKSKKNPGKEVSALGKTYYRSMVASE